MLGSMYRVYFDSNESTQRGYGLWLSKSKGDLSRIPGGPREGLVVTIYMVGEIEMEAALEWSAEWNAWTATPIEGTMRDNTESWDDHAHSN